jgi:hypothetical protein
MFSTRLFRFNGLQAPVYSAQIPGKLALQRQPATIAGGGANQSCYHLKEKIFGGVPKNLATDN